MCLGCLVVFGTEEQRRPSTIQSPPKQNERNAILLSLSSTVAARHVFSQGLVAGPRNTHASPQASSAVSLAMPHHKKLAFPSVRLVFGPPGLAKYGRIPSGTLLGFVENTKVSVSLQGRGSSVLVE